MLRNVPLPIEPIICGQYIEIAMPVKKDAIPGLMPLSATVGRDLARTFLPGSTSIGHTRSPSCAVRSALLSA